MGTFNINCLNCNKLFMWWSGNLDQRCEECKDLDNIGLEDREIKGDR